MGRSSGKKLKNTAKTRGAIFGGAGEIQKKAESKRSIFISKTDFEALFQKLRQEATDRGEIDREALKLKVDKNLVNVDLSGLNLNHSQFGEVAILESAAGNKDNPKLSSTFRNNVFSGTQLQESSFLGCDFSDSQFLSAKMLDCDFSNASFNNTLFFVSDGNARSKETIVDGCVFNNSSFENAKIGPGCQIINSDFFGCEFSTSVQFSNVNFSGSTFKDMEFELASFQGSDLDDVVFENCDLDSGNLSYCSLKNASFENTLPGNTKSIITDIDFYESDLTGAVFNKVSLERPFFYSHTTIDKISVKNSAIANTDFIGVSVSDSVFEKTQFSNVNFTNADFKSVKFIDCDFSDCILPDNLPGAVFENCTGL